MGRAGQVPAAARATPTVAVWGVPGLSTVWPALAVIAAGLSLALLTRSAGSRRRSCSTRLQSADSARCRRHVVATQTSQSLRQRRLDAGLSQRELATRSGVPQPNIAPYETGRRAPAASTLECLDEVLAAPTLERVRAAKESILRAAASRRLSDVRLFGSVARGEAGVGSDVDLLVRPGPDASVFDLAGFMADVEELLGVGVDVVSDRGRGPVMDRIRAGAVAL